MLQTTVSSWSWFCWLYRAFPSLAAKNSSYGRIQLMAPLPLTKSLEMSLGASLSFPSHIQSESKPVCSYKSLPNQATLHFPCCSNPNPQQLFSTLLAS